MIGKTVSHYRILEKLGEGGMGVVYKAEDTKLKRTVALKFLPRGLEAHEPERARFLQEAQAASALNHPNICAIHTLEEHEGEQFIDLEFVDGVTLRQKIQSGQLALNDVIACAIQIGEALQEAHGHGIVHRDVKPENIMLNSKNQIKVMDFGLAKLKGSLKLTKTSSTIGTLAYMSPEQIRGKKADARSDIFSFGIVLYEMLTGHLPFHGEHEAAMMHSILTEEPEPIQKYRPELSSEFHHIMDRALEKGPEERYQSVHDMLIDLKREWKKTEYAKTGYVSESGAITQPVLIPKWRSWKVAAGIAGIVLIAIIGLYLFYSRSVPPPAKSKSIAVLPFKNLSDNKDDEYFSDGMTDDIIAQLSKITGLKVISRTSVMQYKGTSKNIRDIGKELDVGSILEGSVRRAGNQVRIVAQLIDAQNEGHLWADTYDEEMTQIFAIQSDVAQRIAAALKAKLSPGEKERIEKIQTENTEAYQLYLKGRFYWNKRTLENHRKAIEYFTQAIEKDPHYALAYAGLASTYVLLPEYYVPMKEVLTEAKAAALKALELDPSLAEPHAALGYAKAYEWDWTGAETEYKKAIELDPSSPTAHQWYAHYLTSIRRLDEALAENKRAQELDPLSLIINVHLGMNLCYMRRFDQAIDQLKKTMELDPNFPWTYLYLGNIYDAQGEFDRAIAAYQRTMTLAGDDSEVLAYLGHAYAKAGRRNDAIKALAELLENSRQGHPVSFNIALVYNGLGDQEKTFEWLERAFQEQNWHLLDLKVYPELDNLRSDPRFIALLKKIGLEK